MKKILTLCAFAVSLLISNKATATHAAGAELIYALVPGTTNTYLFTYKFYRDCEGLANAPTSVTMCYYNTCGASSSVVLNQIGSLPNGSANGTPVGTGCPGFPTFCNGGTIPGYEEWWYQGTVTLNTQCNKWTFYTVVNARNNAIGNLDNPGAQSLYVECTFDNTITQNNSSPYFSNPPIPYCCVNQLFNYNNGAVDPNGDSLVFTSINPSTAISATVCQSNNSQPCLYTLGSGFTPTNPFSNSLFTVNASTGAVSFIPTAIGRYVITIRVDEYRNGVLLGYVMRDIQIIVENCNTPSPTLGIDSISIVGGSLLNGVIQGCAGDSLNFCVDLTSSSPSAILVPTDNHLSSAAGSTITYTNTLTDSIRACFSWPTTLTDTGLHILTITIKDSNCAPPGILVSNTFSIPIYINPITKAFSDTTICLGDSSHLHAVGGNTFHWTTLPGGDDSTSLSCTYCADPWASPTQTTSYVVVSDLASLCNRSTDTITISVAPTVQLQITPNSTTCVNSTLQLNVSAIPNTGTYTYVWSPPTYLSNPFISNPIVQYPLSSQTYTVTVSSTIGGVLVCPATAQVTVTALQGFNILNNDTTICKGSSVNIVSTGGNPAYTFTWTPAGDVSNPNVLNTTITPSTTGTTTYTVKATFPTCPDSSQSITITTNPIPIADAGIDREMCNGDTVHLQGSALPLNGTFTYDWSPASDLNDASILNPIFDGVVTTVFTLTVTDTIGCKGTDNVIISVVPANFLVVDGNRTLCPGQTTTLSVNGGVSYLWSPSLYVSDSTASNITVNPITTTDFIVYGVNAKGCIDTGLATVVVNANAVVDAGENQTLYPGEVAQLYANGNCSFFTWSPPNGLSALDIKNPIASPSVTTRYFVSAKTEFGCKSMDSVDVIISPQSILELPNAFSPGSGTSVNDELKIIIRGVAKLNTFRIFDRWGKEVFSTTDITKGWNGRYNNKPQPLGTYVYVIDAVTSTGQRFYKQGNVTLVR